ncbi:hypothetical protein AOC36_06295 [Erysipelothrix larvae]|uniref:Metallo-beta-lactamase domain-containing protein n=1 Tax=Erysipelothrix larvae TaxID=1514105 RepID=A0A0X8H037_9FIRM|nr:MBL fold metallo-hydrolase [Erysipelothrix larvae]AMC93608.1 hypothetical protein AOC36_06295 [Erysipelothrix larvae]
MNHLILTNRHHVLMYDDVFEGIYLNIHIIITPPYIFVIDSGLGAQTAQDINHIIHEYGNNQPIILINSHAHWDHVWGNAFIDSAWIVSHKRCLEVLKSDLVHDYETHKTYARGAVIPKYPNLTFDQTLIFEEAGIELGFAPGHTDNDIYVYDHFDHILNVGDNIGDTVEECIPYLETSQEIYVQSIKRYQSYDVKWVVSGHNEVVDASMFDKILDQLK